MFLYSRQRPLKNVIADFKKNYGVNRLVVEWDYIEPPREEELTPNGIKFYNAVVNKYYFANIGFDTDEQFIFRFNAIWRENFSKYDTLANDIDVSGYAYEMEEHNTVRDVGGQDTYSESGSRETVTEKSGKDTFSKGVTTTSNQNTSNVGNKLTRQTPNENLSVDGQSSTTVSDSGSDENLYGSVVTSTETPDIEKVQAYGKTESGNVGIIRKKLTPTEVQAIYKLNSIYTEFALLFEKLFLGVY